MTEEQKKLAEENHNLIYFYARKYHISKQDFDDMYGIFQRDFEDTYRFTDDLSKKGPKM